MNDGYLGRTNHGVKGTRSCLNLLCVLCVLCGVSNAQTFTTVAPGVEYAEVTRTIDYSPVHMNLLRLDLKKVRLDVVHAMDAAIGLEKTSSIATRHGAFAAINGGFFRLDDSIWAGDPAGILMVEGRLWSESEKDRASIAIKNGDEKTEVIFGHFETQATIKYERDVVKLFSGINRERKANEMILYSPGFGESTLTSKDGTEIILTGCFRAYICQKVEVLEKTGNSKIPADGYVVSIGANSPTGDLIDSLKYSSKDGQNYTFGISLSVGSKTGDGKKFQIIRLLEDVTNGVPQLIKNGKIDITWEEEKTNKRFVETRHPRTAVAKLKHGKFLMITVDGRNESSGGISLTDLAAYLLELGAIDAMNLDGGGSSTMVLDGKVVNHPSDKEGERKVSDAILVTLRK
jgi:exopolysaccharide biosynthesis protein